VHNRLWIVRPVPPGIDGAMRIIVVVTAHHIQILSILVHKLAVVPLSLALRVLMLVYQAQCVPELMEYIGLHLVPSRVLGRQSRVHIEPHGGLAWVGLRLASDIGFGMVRE
jgi:hypothetical protein